MLAPDSVYMLEAPPCKVEGDGALLLAPRALIASPLAPDALVGWTASEDTVEIAVLVAKTVTLVTTVVAREVVRFAVGAKVEVEVAVTVTFKKVLLPVGEAYSALKDDSYLTCAWFE